MAKKFKDYYDSEFIDLITDKLQLVFPNLDAKAFKSYLKEKLPGNDFTQRQDIVAEAFEKYLDSSYSKNITKFEKILGPELETTEGMFTLGWWLWPVGRYVQRNGTQDFDASMHFIYELTKRFTGEFAIRPLLREYPKKTLAIIETWSKDENVHVRRLASESMRIKLPWAQKLTVALDEFKTYKLILTNLKAAPEKFVQKSVGNNLNDLMKEDKAKAMEIIKEWQKDNLSKATVWIIKHGMRSLKKKK